MSVFKKRYAKYVPITIIILISLITISCKKEKPAGTDCFSDDAIIRTVVNQQAKVIAWGSTFYLVEQGTIDSRLNPCVLPEEYKVNNLVVMISGAVKATVNTAFEPCCTENFVITEISI